MDRQGDVVWNNAPQPPNAELPFSLATKPALIPVEQSPHSADRQKPWHQPAQISPERCADRKKEEELEEGMVVSYDII